jgi:hypothetical protein
VVPQQQVHSGTVEVAKPVIDFSGASSVAIRQVAEVDDPQVRRHRSSVKTPMGST